VQRISFVGFCYQIIQVDSNVTLPRTNLWAKSNEGHDHVHV